MLILAVSLAACRQPDAPMPMPNATVEEELLDVKKDLQNVAGNNPTAPQELADDLRKYAVRPAARPAVDELTKRTTTVLVGRNVSEQLADRLARSLWTTIAAREISERQVEALQNDVRSMLVSIGVAEEGAMQVATQVGEVQKAVTNRPRRWYEFF